MATKRGERCDVFEEEEYDIGAVEARLARMQRQRDARRARNAMSEAQLDDGERPLPVSMSQNSNRAAAHSTQFHASHSVGQQHNVADICATAEFELNAAELSAGSDSESEDEGSASTNSLSSDDARTDRSTGKRPTQSHEAAPRTRKAGLKDSLDLSMSVAELSRPRKQDKPIKKNGNVPKSASTAPLRYEPHDAPDRKGAPLDKTERHTSETDDSGGDLWMSKLVQRRRMLEKEAAVAKEDSVATKTGPTAPALSQVYRDHGPRDEQPSFVPSSSRSATANAARPGFVANLASQNSKPPHSMQDPQAETRQREEISRHRSGSNTNSNPVARNTPTDALPKAMALEGRPERAVAPQPLYSDPVATKPSSTGTKSLGMQPRQLDRAVATAGSSLKPPERYKTNNPRAAATSVAHSGTSATRKHIADKIAPRVQDNNVMSTRKAIHADVGLPTASPAPLVHTSETQHPSKHPGSKHVQMEPEDDDFLLTAEEEKLRQSLVKLDTRLLKLHTTKKSSAPSATTTACQATAAPDEVSHQDVDDDTIRAASYGGGTHCKRGQPTSASERSSYIKRTEMSNGLHKLRVRVGGALVQDDNNTNLDKDGRRHKVLVKKDLAHLLF